jgi:hypothetical protein
MYFAKHCMPEPKIRPSATLAGPKELAVATT